MYSQFFQVFGAGVGVGFFVFEIVRSTNRVVADDLLFHRVADIAVRAVLQIAVRGGIALKRQQRPPGPSAKSPFSQNALNALQINRWSQSLNRKIGSPSGRPLAALQRRDRRALSHFWQRHMRAAGQYALIFFVDGKVADMLLEHHKREVRAVHKLFHAARRPVKERLSVNFDQRFRADKAVFKNRLPLPAMGRIR